MHMVSGIDIQLAEPSLWLLPNNSIHLVKEPLDGCLLSRLWGSRGPGDKHQIGIAESNKEVVDVVIDVCPVLPTRPSSNCNAPSGSDKFSRGL